MSGGAIAPQDGATQIPVAAAARNNAAWCDAVCSAHGSPGRFTGSHWMTARPAPPLYPNLVTLDRAPAPVLAAIREIERALPAAAWGVKDSFAALSLEGEGFRLLFEAEWIARAPGPIVQRRDGDPVRVERVAGEAALRAWEDAWGESAGGPRRFPPSLLARGDVAFLAARDAAGAIAAGLVASRAAGAVGLSNFFARGNGDEGLRAACIGAAAGAFPGLPLVGYESGGALEACRGLGFAPIGALRVWVRET